MERSAEELTGHSRATERQTGMRSGWSVWGPKRPPKQQVARSSRVRGSSHSVDAPSLSMYGRRMPLDSSLLGQARAAEARAINAEHDAEVAPADFHRAIRRLQLAGGSLREIAEELRLSHQRVHQIVEATGGSRTWRGDRAGAGGPLSCPLSPNHQHQVNTR